MHRTAPEMSAATPSRVVAAIRRASTSCFRRDHICRSCFLNPIASSCKDGAFANLNAGELFSSLEYFRIESQMRNARLVRDLNRFNGPGVAYQMMHSRNLTTAAVELRTEDDVVRFTINKPSDKDSSRLKSRKIKKKKMSRKAKVNELKFYRLKAKKKMNSPNPEVRIRYKLEKAKRKEAWLIEKLRKYEVPKALPETYDPEILTEEEKHYLKRTGEKKKNYVPVGRRGVFGGVVLNMHLHWKKHETVKVVCRPCRPGQIHEYADELARLSKGIVIDIKPNNTIVYYRGKNYVRPDIMSPPDTLSKQKALEKYRYEQSLEHTSQFIEKLEYELEEYHKHVARFQKGTECAYKDSGEQKKQGIRASRCMHSRNAPEEAITRR